MGPTATGKTDLALRIAESVPSRLISVDSAMVYRGLDIGTAKPSKEILDRCPHDLIDIREPEMSYTVGDFCASVDGLIESALQQERLPILVGGSMMYFRSFMQGLATVPPRSTRVREVLGQEREQLGTEALYQRLQKVDPLASKIIHPNNWARIERALEVFKLTGKPLTDYWQEAQTEPATSRLQCRLLAIATSCVPRRDLHERILIRATQMFESGFLEEVRTLQSRPHLGARSQSMQCVGYKQVWDAVERNQVAGSEKELLLERVVVATRQLARRQLIWLRNWTGCDTLHRIGPDSATTKVLDLLEAGE